MKGIFLGMIGAVVLFGIAACEVSVWSECRIDHSVYYCLRVLNK